MRPSLAVAVLAIACGTPPMMQPDAGSDAGSVMHWPSVAAANALPDTDPRAEGQYRFLYDAWGTEQQHGWPPVDFMLGLMQSEPDVFGNQFSKFGFIPDPNDDLPIGFKRGLVDKTQVHETCAACHTAKLPDGRLWLGAPNTAYDADGFRVAVNDRWVAAGHASTISDLDRMKMLAQGPGRTDASTGGYPTPVPAKFPSCYQLGQRSRTNYLGTGRNVRSEAYLAIFSFGAGDPTAAIQVPFPPTDHVDAFLSFFGTIDPPKGPAQDTAAVMRGQQVFHTAQCDTCHHPDDPSKDVVTTVPTDTTVPEYVPGAQAMYPNGTVQTDPLHRTLITQNGPPKDGGTMDNGYLIYLEFIQDNNLAVGSTDGYRVGYLGGLWGRPPYLHNGSVPTIEDLLKPAAQRPASFMVGSFTVDTTTPGNGAQGHEWGTALSDSDKADLAAYLKSL
jgi:mono/diheme cytochrome c family protein